MLVQNTFKQQSRDYNNFRESTLAEQNCKDCMFLSNAKLKGFEQLNPTCMDGFMVLSSMKIVEHKQAAMKL